MKNIPEEQIIVRRPAKVVYREGDTVVKLFNSDYSKASVLNEALNQARVEETGLNIPKILEIFKVEEQWAIRSEFIEGKTLQAMMEEQPERKDEYMALFVSLQRQVHSRKAPLLTTLKDKMTRKISYSELAATVRYDLQVKLREMSGPSYVCHCDFSPSNVFIREDGTPFILDWSHATQGDPCVDAAVTYILFLLSGDGGAAETYLSLFCEKAGMDAHSVLKWVPVAAASKSIKTEGADKEFLLSLANTVDYQNGGITK